MISRRVRERLFSAVAVLAVVALSGSSADAQLVGSGGLSADVWIADAAEREASGDYPGASQLYLLASAHDAQLSRFLRLRAVQSLLAAEAPPVDRLATLAAGAETWGFAGAARAAVEVSALQGDGLPSAELLRGALETSDRETICEWLTPRLQRQVSEAIDSGLESGLAMIVDLHHGWCSDTENESFAEQLGVEPTVAARVRRAERLREKVRFYAAAAELEALGGFQNIDDLELKCRAIYTMARTTYRIRKRRSESGPLYAGVAEECTADGLAHLRKSALYNAGKRRYDLRDVAGAKPFFETLLADYPAESHADDAVFYLARIARAEGDRERELELVDLAQRDYQAGDMFGELVWEVFETHYKEGEYEEFINAVTAVDRPEHDGFYYSQGRLEYFVAQAFAKLGKRDEAHRAWSAAWDQYPWSFYGYLSRMQLIEAGEVPGEPSVDPDAKPPWLESRAHRLGPIGRLMRAGSPGLSVAYANATSPKSDDDRWRRAFAYDAAGLYEVSHNIVRRQIGGRPWQEPPEGRLVQWRLAWPDPFGELVDRAVAEEREQNAEPSVDGALAKAIMREESSFIVDIESYAGALGLMQLMPRTALGHDDDIEGEATPERLKTAEVNVRVGVDHLFWLARRFDGHPVLMVAAYNAGSGRIDRWMREFGGDDIALFVEDIPSKQTRGYTKRVIGSYAAYQWLAGRSDLDKRVLGAAE